MRIGIVSDTHGDAAAWQGLMAGVFRGVDLVVHAGDVLFPGPRHGSGAALAALLNACPCPVLCARGNCDSEEDELLLDFPLLAPYVFLQAEGLRIVATHGHTTDRPAALARRWRVPLVVQGHTHVPRLDEEDGVVLLNPGSPALPKGGFPTAALVEGSAVLLWDLAAGRVVAQKKVKNGRL